MQNHRYRGADTALCKILRINYETQAQILNHPLTTSPQETDFTVSLSFTHL